MRTKMIFAAAAMTCSSCMLSKFDDYESKAPAVRIAQTGEELSHLFGDFIVAFPGVGADDGAQVVASASSPSSFSTASFNKDGLLGTVPATVSSTKLIEQFGSLQKINGMAEVPAKLTEGKPRHVYVAVELEADRKVYAMNVETFETPADFSREKYPDALPDVSNFATSVAAARFNHELQDDMVIGAMGKVVFWKYHDATTDNATASPNALFNVTLKPYICGGGTGATKWPTRSSTDSNFDVLAVGQLDDSTPAEDEVVVAASALNYVAVIHHYAACTEDNADANCKPTILEIPVPAGAVGFGDALLIKGKTLYVGAPDTPGGGAVYRYEFKNEHFQPNATIPSPTVRKAPAGAAKFGDALAIGNFDNNATNTPLLAVGAPDSDQGTHKKAGRVYLFNSQLSLVSPVQLTSPPPAGQLGRTLVTVPWKKGNKTYELLGAASQEFVYVFFAFTTPNHDDPRLGAKAE